MILIVTDENETLELEYVTIEDLKDERILPIFTVPPVLSP